MQVIMHCQIYNEEEFSHLWLMLGLLLGNRIIHQGGKRLESEEVVTRAMQASSFKDQPGCLLYLNNVSKRSLDSASSENRITR